MNDVDAWIYLDGPEPESIRPFLDSIRDLPPSTPEQKERIERGFLEKLDAALARREALSVATTAPLTHGEGEHRGGDDGPTARSPTLDERTATAPPPEPIAPPLLVNIREPRPAEGQPAESLIPTPITLELPAELPAELREQMGRLPFKPLAPGRRAARTLQVPVMNPRQGETAPLDDDAIAKAKALATLPFDGTMIGAGVVPFPRLSLDQYASLRAELSVSPEQSDEILPRYYVRDGAARRALDEHWQIQLAASPEVRAMFDKALAEFTDWLRAVK